MKSVFKVLCLCLLISSVQSCDDWWNPDGVIIYDKDDLEKLPMEDDEKDEINYTLNKSITINGFNLKYSISKIKLSIGEVLRVRVDSETVPKPEVIILWDSEEVVRISNLPDSLGIEMTNAGLHKLTFQCQFGETAARTSSVDISVE